MMNKFFYLLMASAMLFVACEENNSNQGNNNDEPKLTLTSDGAMVFDSEGGMGEITYSITNPSADIQVSARASVNWIIYVDATVSGKVSFQVIPNPTQEARTGAITVSYGEQSFDVVINQKINEGGADVSVELPNICGIYYGNRDGGAYNYYFMITDGGMTFLRSEGSYDIYAYDYPNAQYYFIDLFVENPDDGSLTIPDGTYTLASIDKGQAGEFSWNFSKYQLNNESGYSKEEYNFSSGKLVVEGDHFELTVTLCDDDSNPLKTHYVEFNGDYTLVDNSL